MNVELGNVPHNLSRIEGFLADAARHGARLTVFPECALCGYCFNSLEEARPHAEPVPGASTAKLAEVCRRLDVFAVTGLLEEAGDRLFNACVLVGPQGVIGTYRKIHLPFLGIDRFTTPGDRPFAVFSAAGLRVGMNICYDGSFPESARVMALAGAELIVLPTNWPPGAECTAESVVPARALENHVYYLAANRVGTERGFRFIGASRVCDPHGRTLAHAPGDDERILYAQVDPALARDKHVVRVPGRHEIDRFKDRRPEFYGSIAAS
jgi:predicted amidohydrolase